MKNTIKIGISALAIACCSLLNPIQAQHRTTVVTTKKPAKKTTVVHTHKPGHNTTVVHTKNHGNSTTVVHRDNPGHRNDKTIVVKKR